MPKYKFYEFFAGGGMARLGLGEEWECIFANDFSPRKAASYRANFPSAEEFKECDVFDLTVGDLPRGADLAWASFPCQDLSLAGNGHGLDGKNSGSFYGFWDLMRQLAERDTPVPLVVLENVVGTITARGGEDFKNLLGTLVDAGYRVGPLVIDAVYFVPQSRPRLFVIGVHKSIGIPAHLMRAVSDTRWHPDTLFRAYVQMPTRTQNSWIWWDLSYPPERTIGLNEVIDYAESPNLWHSEQQTKRLIELMSPLHQSKLQFLQRSGLRVIGTVYRRIRSVDGTKVQRAELRTDNISGCLRTGSGGSSKQFILVIEGDRVRSRLISPREAARLMGVCEEYKLPENFSEAYHLMGDGVVVSAVSWLSDNILVPILDSHVPVYETAIPTLSIEQLRLLERKSRTKQE